MNRRSFLRAGAALASATLGASFLASPALAFVNNPSENRILKLYNDHTNERVEVAYWRSGWYDFSSFQEIEYILRDWRENITHTIDPTLCDVLYDISENIGGDKEIIVLSGYRTQKTNKMIRERGLGQSAKNSLHMKGKAVDFTIPSYKISKLHKIAERAAVGGLGYYPRKNFIHVDTGAVRHWRA